MTVVVTGANGHIGANLVRALLARGRQVRALIHRDRKAIEGLNVETISGDICDLESLYRAFSNADVVFHLAATISLSMYSWSTVATINVVGTRNVVEACLKSGVRRLVHFSSIHALKQEPLDVPVDEGRSLVASHNCPPYDRSKAEGEKEVRRGIEKGLNAVIIYPTGIIGPHDYQPSHFGEVLLTLVCGKLPGLVAGGFNWVDVRDVVDGAIKAEEKAAAGTGYLLSGHWASLPDLAALVAEFSGVPAPGFVCPLWLARAGAPLVTAVDYLTGRRPLYTRASIRALYSNRNISHEKATRELDYQPRPIRATILDTLRWFEEKGWLAQPLKTPPARLL